ncbi:MAG: hypothetical protein QM754_08200 [Tepidisphaeraceae bacterium]
MAGRGPIPVSPGATAPPPGPSADAHRPPARAAAAAGPSRVTATVARPVQGSGISATIV